MNLSYLANRIAVVLGGTMLVASCGFEQTINVKESPDPALTGQFVDSPVQGLSYSSESFSGSTNENGEFSYYRGDFITFSIGELEFPGAAVSGVMTPMALFSADNVFSQPVVNTLRLLQALDTDGDPSNGITISDDAAAAATMLLADGETAADFFAQSDEDFAADVEVWLPAAGGSASLVSSDAAIDHFVSYLEDSLGTLVGTTFDPDVITGTLYHNYLQGTNVVSGSVTFTPSEDDTSIGTYVYSSSDSDSSGEYSFAFGRRVLVLTSGDETTYLIARALDTVSNVYSLCVESAGDQSLVSLVEACDGDDDPKNSLLSFSEEQAAEDVLALEEAASNIPPALYEEFNTDTSTFFTSTYKDLSDDLEDDPMYYKTGGSPSIDAELGQMTLEGDRFSIGNTTPGVLTTANDTGGSGVFNLSQGFTISFDVVSHNGGGNLNVYVDNNTTGQDNSVHGAASKIIGLGINDDNFPQGERFSYTYEPGADVNGNDPTAADAKILDSTITNSFFQFRTDSSGRITIDNLKIETIAEAVDPSENTGGETEEPEEQLDIPTVDLPLSYDFAGVTDDIFSTAFAEITNAAGEAVSMLTRTGGSVTVVDSGLEIDGGRFTLGDSEPGTLTTAADTTTTGVLDLSRPYKVVMDIVSATDSEGGNKFQIYVDNNTSGSANSIHAGDSRIYNELVSTLVAGTTLEVEGEVGTENSFIQLRVEDGAVVVINNLRIEYLDDGSIFSCADEPDLYFCDDFSTGTTDNWELVAQPTNTTGAVGEFDILNDNGNKVLRYTAGNAGGEILRITEAAMANIPDTADYFVEARIRPRQNSTTANKQLYMMGRYASEGNWYGGGLNVQNSTSSTRVEVAVSTDGSVSRPVQAAYPIELGTQGASDDGVWYRVRFEMDGSDLTVYLDGQNMGSVSDSSYTTKGLIGLFTNNRSFEIDDIKVGNPDVKPVQLTLDYTDTSWTTSTTSDPLTVYVTAVQDDGITADTYTVTSSDEAVVSVTQQDDVNVVLTPLTEGTATITFTSGSDPTLVKTIEVMVSEGFVMPTSEYGDISAKVTPDLASSGNYIDTSLSITFDSTPTLGDVGEVRIYDSSDNSVVDVLTVSDDIDSLGYDGQDRLRRVYYRSLSIDGNTLTIKPHNGVIDYDKTYFVAIGDGVVSGVQLNGVDFSGLGVNAGWEFTTQEIAPSGTDVTVDDDGVADFRTVQGALNYVMENVAKDTAATITVKEGSYNELLFIRNKNNLTIQGEDRDNTVIFYDNYESYNSGSGGSEPAGTGTPGGGRSVLLVEGADNLVLNNLTLKNSHVRNSTDSNQAETIYFNSSYRLTANNANFISEQDTLLLKGYSWFYNCLVAGNVDFIWGYPTAALFEESEIRSIGDSKYGADTDSPGGYVLQARVPNETDPGFVFLNSEFTHGPGPLGNDVLDDSTYIARSGGNTSYYDNITLINNKFDTHIASVGWAAEGVNSQPAPTPDPATATAGWREYGSMDMNGDPLDLSSRVGGYLLDASEISAYESRTAVFSGYNSGAGWTPDPLDAPVIVAEETDKGFAGYNYDITGGAGGTVVTVDNGADLVAALDAAADANTPVTVYVDGTITVANTGSAPIYVKDMDNVSIIGVSDRGELDGIGIKISRANNVIIQNLKIHNVDSGDKDAIGIEGDDDSGTTTTHIWIDHNELYSSLDVDKDYYDGLLDSKTGARYITISYNYLHDHWKASLHGHTEDDSAEAANTERFITFHHNRFENIESRLPLFRRGYGHLYNNYYNNIDSTAINSRIGAELLVENNVFENTQNPIVSFYSSVIGYWNQIGNLFSDGVTWTTPESGYVSGEDGSSTSSYTVPYDYTLDDASLVKSKVINHAGVGKLDQSNLDIPDVTDSSDDTDTVTATDVSLPFEEDFSAADASTFFSADYKNIGSDLTVPLYGITGGGATISVSGGQMTLLSGRFTIGDPIGKATATASSDTAGRGVLDLSRAYKVIVQIESVGGTTTKKFQLYVDNNTSSSGSSMHGSASKFYEATLDSLSAGTLEIDGLVATDSSFLQVRTETDGSIVMSSIRIEYTD